MSQQLTGILCFLLVLLSACSQAETAKQHPEGNATHTSPITTTPSSPTPLATPIPTPQRKAIPSALMTPLPNLLDGLPTSPGAMMKKFSESIIFKDAEWYLKYMKPATIRIASRVKNEQPLSDQQIRNQFAMMTGMKGNKPEVKKVEIIQETINGDKSQVSLMVYRVNNTSETVQFTLTKIDGMWVVGDFPDRK